jgi:hypothetical protein
MVMKQISILAMVILLLSACNIISNSSFWLAFQKGNQVSKNYNQGARGGYLQVSWKCSNENCFQTKELSKYAKQNGWEYLDSIAITKNECINWKYNDKDIFPLANTGFNYRDIVVSSSFQHFPRDIDTDLTVYRFKTKVLLFEAGTDENTDINGFIVVSKSKKQMSVYHYWGE